MPDTSADRSLQPNPETRFRALFEQAPVSLQILAADGTTVRVNEAWSALWQIHPGTPVMDFVVGGGYNVLTDPQLDAKGVLPFLRRAFAGESVHIPAIRYDTAELGTPGPSRWVTARAHPLTDADGRVLEVMLMHEDITDRVLAESALRAREERFRSLVTATSQIIWTAGPDGRAISVSPSWQEFTGQGDAEWSGLGWLDALPPHDREPAARRWEAANRAQRVFDAEYRLRRVDGSYRWMSAKGVPVFDPDGALREWIGANTDIHDMVMAQTALAQRLERERRTSALLAKVAGASRTLHAALSPQDIADALAAQVRDILQADTVSVALDGAAAGDRPADGPGGHPVLAVPLIGRDGARLGSVSAAGESGRAFDAEDEAILVQLAAIAAVGLENAQLVAALRDQDRRKDEFLAMLAHELRNPLAPISAAAQVLRRAPLEALDGARLRQYSEIIARQVSHMSALMNDLLDVSRVTRGMVRLDLAPVAVHAVLTSAAEQVQPLVEARRHAFAVELDAPGVHVDGDRARLVQVVTNLLTNAAKYTPPGGRIVLSARIDGGQVRIAVADNGSGIEPSLLPHVFELFTQGKRTLDRSQGGLGLGLALVKSMVALHGGSVEAHSEGAGRGSVFTIVLPLSAGAAADAAAAAAGVQGPPRRSLHVLVVDDNADSVVTLGALLQAYGHRVTTLTDAAVAAVSAADVRPDVCILDIGMPGMDGYELVRRLRRNPASAAALCIAISGYGQADDRQAAFAAGFDHHFAKPVDAEALLALLAKY